MARIRFLYHGIETEAVLAEGGWEHPLPTVKAMLDAHGQDAAKVAERLNGQIILSTEDGTLAEDFATEGQTEEQTKAEWRPDDESDHAV